MPYVLQTGAFPPLNEDVFQTSSHTLNHTQAYKPPGEKWLTPGGKAALGSTASSSSNSSALGLRGQDLSSNPDLNKQSEITQKFVMGIVFIKR